MTHAPPITVVGAGLAGCEAALQLASRGIPVRLVEQKPLARTPAQSSDALCELVCSNSLRGIALSNAVGLLKEEMRRLGSFTIRTADACRVPAGGALAVDRERFSLEMSRQIDAHPLIERITAIVDRISPERPLVLATGPLTGPALASDIERLIGSDSLAYYDAIAPVVRAETIDWELAFLASRWDKGEDEAERTAYANLPLDEGQYRRFVHELRAATKVPPREFEEPRYFEGCLPVEVMAERGEMTLAFGPMKPVGLIDPRTGRRPFAVVQLRKEDLAGTAYNLVGFQTRMTQGEQGRVFRLIPGLEGAEFERFGAVHRNTFLNAPRLLDGTFRLRGHDALYFAGQITGVEGYVESAASGWLVAYAIAARVEGREPDMPPPTTAHGGLLEQLRRNESAYQPSNITFSHIAPWEGARLKKRPRYEAIAARALAALDEWRGRRDSGPVDPE